MNSLTARPEPLDLWIIWHPQHKWGHKTLVMHQSESDAIEWLAENVPSWKKYDWQLVKLKATPTSELN